MSFAETGRKEEALAAYKLLDHEVPGRGRDQDRPAKNQGTGGKMRDINSLNKVILIGRLGQKPDSRFLPQTQSAGRPLHPGHERAVLQPEHERGREQDRVAPHRRLGQARRVLRKVPHPGQADPPRGQAQDPAVAGQGRQQAQHHGDRSPEHRPPRPAGRNGRRRAPSPKARPPPTSRWRATKRPTAAGAAVTTMSRSDPSGPRLSADGSPAMTADEDIEKSFRKKIIEDIRPWGKFRAYPYESGSAVKIITVDPGQSLSLQYHRRRAEFWIALDPGSRGDRRRQDLASGRERGDLHPAEGPPPLALSGAPAGPDHGDLDRRPRRIGHRPRPRRLRKIGHDDWLMKKTLGCLIRIFSIMYSSISWELRSPWPRRRPSPPCRARPTAGPS